MKKTILFATALALAASTASAQTEGDVIDMGLSVKWHSCNYGATSPKSAGDIYAFADTAKGGYYSASMYPFYDSWDWKYNLPLTDVAGTDKDAAWVGSNGACRMPTNEEWQELIDNCTVTSYTYDGTSGYLLTSNRNGNSIFMPKIWYTSGWNEYQGVVYYGSTAQSTTAATIATVSESGNPNFYLTSFTTPYNGLPIRPVVEGDSGPVLTGIVITADKTTLYAGTTLQLSVAPEPAEALIKGAVWTSSNPEVATVSDKGVVFGISAGTTTISVTSGDVVSSLELTVEEVVTSTADEYVDLGLSVLWSAWNLGADAYGELGDKYSWGYVTAGPATSNLTYTFFNKSTFQYNLPAMDICGMNAYDAVYVATDGEAQLPSSAQMEELLENCDVILASKAGVDGLLLTSKINGKSLFFPLGASSAVYYTGSSNDLKTEVYSVVLNEGSTALSVVLRNTPYIGGYLRGVKFRKDVTLESLVISNPELDVYVANAKQLSVSSVPDGINLENVVWTSSNPAIAEVSASGLVKGMAPGECFVTASLDGVEVSSSVLVSEIAVQSGAYVDMGTDVLWATCNLGARAPYELGDYYAFGAVTTSETPSDYPDNIRGTDYDVAHKELGSSYFIPTPAEYQALIDNTDMEWVIWPTEENPTAQGALLTSRTTGNKLYFRATVRGQVYYNTSMVNTQDPSITQAYHAVEQEQVIGGLSSFIQLPVRAVCTDMTSGVEAIVSDSDSSDVYTLSGILVKSGATSADINALPAGLYIVRNGAGAKKIAVK